ncbi:MAG: type IV secretion system DNA-binding domain-containing protein, partial [Rhizobiales bacterium]|nr:type IV secretion system DNA-binding domain-containing protein [Hyphomicrobiales bacterium]
KPARTERPSLLAAWAIRRLPTLPATINGETLLGIDQQSGRKVTLDDTDANHHTMVLGTPGSGKTVAVLNLIESAIERALPLIVIDGKGDRALADKVIAHARRHGRPAYLFAMTGDSCRYNPLSSGGHSARKDRIIELRDWSEDHYRKLAEGYLQMVFKVLDACGIKTDLVTLAGYLSTDRLQALIRKRERRLGNAAMALAEEVDEQVEAERQAEGLRAEVRNLARSEIGPLFDTTAKESGDDVTLPAVLELPKAIAEKAVVYFCLPALQFPALAKTFGKVVINDLKAAAHDQFVRTGEARPIYTVFDEFSVFAGEQVINVVNQGRGFGIHAVLATQSVADLGRATPDTPDHFTRQVLSACNTYLVHRLNAPEDATQVAELIGTKDGIEHTAQIDMIGATGLGSVRRTKGFIVHPDVIKQLRRGEAVFVNKNSGQVLRIRVRLGQIGR